MKWIFRFSPRVSDTSQWAEDNSWYSPHLALTPAAECTLEQREIKALVYIFMSIKQIWIWGISVDVDHLLSIYVFLYWHEYKRLISFITVLSYAVDCVSYVCEQNLKSTSCKYKTNITYVVYHLCVINFNLEGTSYSHLYPWHGWTGQQCHPQRWVWLGSLHHREVGCGTGSPLGPTLCLLLFLWLLKGRRLCPGRWLSLGQSVLHWVDCRPWWVWWWSAAALEGHFAGFPLPKYPAMKWQHQCHMLYKLFRGALWV